MGKFVPVNKMGLGKAFIHSVDNMATIGGYAIWKSGIGGYGANASKSIAKAGIYGAMAGETIGLVSSFDNYNESFASGVGHTIVGTGLGSVAGAGVGAVAAAIAKGLR